MVTFFVSRRDKRELDELQRETEQRVFSDGFMRDKPEEQRATMEPYWRRFAEIFECDPAWLRKIMGSAHVRTVPLESYRKEVTVVVGVSEEESGSVYFLDHMAPPDPRQEMPPVREE